MRIETVLLDLGDTVFGLGPFPGDIPARVAEALRASGFATTDTLAQAIAAAARAFYTEPANEESFIEADLGALARTVAESLGTPIEALQAAAVADAFADADICRFLGTAESGRHIRALRGAVSKVGIVSNTTTPPHRLDAYLREIGVLAAVDVVVYSAAFGRRKPHPDIYREALRALAAEAQTTLFVGDRVREDIRGPMAVGMRAALTHEFRQEEPGDSGANAVINSLADLPRVIALLG